MTIQEEIKNNLTKRKKSLMSNCKIPNKGLEKILKSLYEVFGKDLDLKHVEKDENVR